MKYIDELPPPLPFDSIEQYLGLRVHEVLEKLYHDVSLCHTPSLEELLSLYEDYWQNQWSQEIRIVKQDLSAQDYKKVGRNALIQYYRRHDPFSQSKTLGIEYKIAFPLQEYEIVGFIDRLALHPDGTYEIHDYKTSSRLPSKNSLQKDRQLALYQLGIREHFHDVEKTDLIWHYLVFDREIRIQKNPKELEEIKNATLELIRTIQQDSQFEPRESILCNWCEYAPLCPAKKHEFKTRALPYSQFDQEEGVFLVYRYKMLLHRLQEQEKKIASMQAELQLLQQEIEDYSQRTDCQALQGREGKLLLFRRKCIRFPQLRQSNNEELRQWLIEHQIWEELSSLDLQKIKQYLLSDNSQGPVRQKLLEYAQTYEAIELEYEENS